MRVAFVVVLALVSGAHSLGTMETVGTHRALAKDTTMDLKERPISKIVNMLKDMKAELEAEARDDEAVYEQLTCWCETGTKEKEKAIADGQKKIEELEAELAEAAAKIAQLKETIKTTRDQIYKNTEALGQATAMRMKETKELHKEETDLIGAIDACKQAIVVLSEHHPELLQLKNAAKKLQSVSMHLLSEVLNKAENEAFKAFLSAADRADGHESFLQRDTATIPGFRSYAPQSGQIFGILKQMKEDFEKNLAETQGNQAKAAEDFAALKAAAEEEIAAGKKAKEAAEASLAEFSEKQAQAFEDLADTKDQLAKDQEFLANLKEQCENADAEYAARVKSRTEEIAAVQDTIVILNNDASFKNFGTSLGFIQLSHHTKRASAEDILRRRAVKLLRNAYKKNPSDPRLALIATAVELDAFVKVKKAIDDMVVELNAQQKNEQEHKAWCVKEMNRNGQETDNKERDRGDLETKLADLTQTIETLTNDIKTLKAEISDLKTQMKRASEDREAENADFQQAAMDQRITQQILHKAINRMSQVYAFLQQMESQQPGAPQMQLSGTHTEPGSAPARFKGSTGGAAEQNAGGKRVIALLEECMNDSKRTEDEAVTAEQDAQTSYETFMKDSNESIEQKLNQITNKSTHLAQAKEEAILTKTDLENAMKELQRLADENADLHKSCDFILRNFDARQDARAAEIEALKEAKAILSGAQ